MSWHARPFGAVLLALVLAFSLAAGAAESSESPRPELSAEALIETARAALDKGDLDDAEFLLEGVKPGEGDVDDLDFLWGTIAAKRSDWQTAIARFRAMLARNPDLPRVRLDLAFAYFQADEDRNAAYHFRLALGTKYLPEIVRARALAFLDRIRRRKSWSITGSLAALPDSNISAATSARSVDLFRLSGDALRGRARDQRRRAEREYLRRIRGADLARSQVPLGRRAQHPDLRGEPVQRAEREPARGAALPVRKVRPAAGGERAPALARRRCL